MWSEHRAGYNPSRSAHISQIWVILPPHASKEL